MKLVSYPDPNNWKELLERPSLDNSALLERVRTVLAAVSSRVIKPLRKFTQQFDGVALENCAVVSPSYQELLHWST
jgi:histidinol dehydrogenase